MADTPAPRRCAGCATEVAPALLSCPACGRLVHAAELKQLAAEADAATTAGDSSAALTAWRSALELLPPDSRQHQIISLKVRDLSAKVGQSPQSPRPPSPSVPSSAPASKSGQRGVWAATIGAIGLGLWKLKFVLGLVLTKGKLLLLGFTKASTFFSMILSLGVYWTAWGWKFALGLVLSIYVHEMGHVAALRRYGIRASAPMFIPGLGAVVRMKQYPASPREDARVGLAGPLWGLGAAAAAYLVFLITQWPSWEAIAKVGAWINLFNLLPVWQLDGSRGFHALTRKQRWLAVAVIGIAWYLTAEGLLALIFVVAAIRALATPPADEPDHAALLQYAVSIAALTALSQLHVAGVEA
jgi:Zn-dependent protease